MTAVAEPSAGGQKLGRYQLIRRVAVGGMAEIYLARLPGVGFEDAGKLVIIKRILPQHALDPELLRMFLDEARLSATLTHPHITEVYDVGQGDVGEMPFFVMEYVHGSNLRQLMQAHARATREAGTTTGDASDTDATKEAPTPLPLAHAVGIVAAAAAGLHHAHAKRGPAGEPLHIVHRDVSPSNVLVSYDGAVKVSDFGIAKWAYQRTQTQEGALKGKFAYMSPEQCRGKPVDARSDVFALGTLLYELTTGAAPFAAETDFEILNKIVSGSPEAPRWRDAREYPPALAAIVMRALAREVEDRTPTAQALQVELETFARAERLEVSTVALGAFMQRLFADELAAWQEAQRAGKSLDEHLAARDARGPRAEARTATDAFAATRRSAAPGRPRRRARAGAAVLVVALVAMATATAGRGWFAASRGRPARDPTTAPAPVVSTGSAAGNNVEAPAAQEPIPARPVVVVPPLVPPSVPVPVAVPNVASRSVRSSDKGAPRRGSRARAAAPSVATPPTAESRLHAWDPDSPVPP
jgi:tRNA A-37 threonylcarbamoyl transferase component Bud32